MNLRHHKAVTLKERYKMKEEPSVTNEVPHVEDDEPKLKSIASKISLPAVNENPNNLIEMKLKNRKDLNIHMFEHYILKKQNMRGALLRK